MKISKLILLLFFSGGFFLWELSLHSQTTNQLYDLSKRAWNIGDFKKAESYLIELLTIEDSLTERNKVAIYNRLGIINKDIGKYNTALDYYKQAEYLYIKSFGEDYSVLSLIYNNMATIYKLKGDNEKALQFYNEAFVKLKESSLSTKFKNIELSKIYLNIGIANIDKNDYQDAIYYLSMSKTLKSKYHFEGLENVYLNLAITYENLNEIKKAEIYYLKSIEEWNKKNNTESIYKSADVYIKYSSFLQKWGGKEKALEFYNKGHQIYLQNYGLRHPYTSKSFLTLGDYYLQNGDYHTALENYQKSIIANTRKFNNKDIMAVPGVKDVISDIQMLKSLKKKAETLVSYSDSLKNKHKKESYLKAALNAAELSLQHITTIRHGYLSQTSKLNITKDEKSFYFIASEACTKLFRITGDASSVKLAYSYVQKSKASLLFEEINQNKAFASVLPDSIRLKKAEIESDIYSLKKLLFDENQKTNPDSEKINKWSHNLFQLNNDYENLITSIESEHAEYKHITDNVKVINLEDLQKKLKKDESILEYSLSPQEEGKQRKLFIFTITKNAINCHGTVLNYDFIGNIDYVRDQMNKKEGEIENIAEYNKFNLKLYSLYKTLIQPVESNLSGNKLFIIPDEEIAYLSFDALLKNYQEQQSMNYAALKFLIYDYCFSYAYASNLLFQEIPHTAHPEFVYAFAPDYAGDNLSSTRFQFGKLENTENEIKDILQWFDGKALVGRAANEEFFKSISGEGGIFHFAMHASAEKNNPDFSFLAITQEDATEDDGYFYNYEIAMMQMKATMVVLSGCNTGDGVISSGEGVMSLTRSFILAGAPSIVHSLWEVQDETSVVIMDKFYENLSKGMAKNDALRQAKLSYIKNVSPAMVNPYFWSGYVHTGNPVPVKHTNYLIYSLISIFILVFLISIFLVIRKIKKSNTNSKV